MDFDLLAVLLNVGTNVFTTLLPWRTRWLMPSVLWWRSRQDQAASLPVTLAESCSIKAVADAVAHAGPPPGRLHGPGALELRVTRILRAPRSAGRLRSGAGLRGFQPRDLDELVGPSFDCEIARRLSARLLPKAAQVEAQRISGLSQVYVNPRVGKCRPHCLELLRALFEQGVIKFRKKARYHCGVSAVWKKNGDQRLIIDTRIPNTAFEAPDAVALATAQSCARVNVGK